MRRDRYRHINFQVIESMRRSVVAGGLYPFHVASEQLPPRSDLFHCRRRRQFFGIQNFLLYRW